MSGLTVGVEEEFLLVDAETRRTTPRAAAVLARAARTATVAETAFQTELVATQVEAATGVCPDLRGLRRQLTDARARLAAAAPGQGARPGLPGGGRHRRGRAPGRGRQPGAHRTLGAVHAGRAFRPGDRDPGRCR